MVWIIFIWINRCLVRKCLCRVRLTVLLTLDVDVFGAMLMLLLQSSTLCIIIQKSTNQQFRQSSRTLRLSICGGVDVDCSERCCTRLFVVRNSECAAAFCWNHHWINNTFRFSIKYMFGNDQNDHTRQLFTERSDDWLTLRGTKRKFVIAREHRAHSELAHILLVWTYVHKVDVIVRARSL